MNQTHFADFKLPEGSLYKPIEDIVAARAQGEDGLERMSIDEYAGPVVSHIIEGNTGKFWHGGNAEAMKYAITHVETSVMVSLNPFHLDRSVG